MPVYAYACTACDHAFDYRQSFTDDPLTICPQCEGKLRKVIGSVGVTFKGSGFYRTDSGAGKAKPSSSAGSSSTSSQGESATSSDSKTSTPSSGSSATSTTAA
ncbi:putative regulatory protein, FmdB family [Micrococcales bacterium KH10]|nr:putative regulatory protein, FmdB family [Micrococcales bacterium KH10]